MAEPATLESTDHLHAAPPRLTALPRLHDLASRLTRTLSLARALVQGGRTLDLTGVDDGIGMLCAQTLDLPPGDARDMLPLLHAVLGQLDLLSVSIHEAKWRSRSSC